MILPINLSLILDLVIKDNFFPLFKFFIKFLLEVFLL